MPSQNITAYLNALGRNTEYAELFTRANQLYQLKQKITAAAVIPAHLMHHCDLGPLSHGILTLFANNASVATRLRHISPSLLKKIQKTGWHITAIKIRVQKPDHLRNNISSNQRQSYANKPRISQAGIDNLNALARTLPDSELKLSVQSLLQKHQQNKAID